MFRYAARLARFSRHPVTQRIALSVLINLIIGFTRSWLGYEQSALIGLLTVFVSVVIADLMLCNREERRARWKQADAFAREHWGGGTKLVALFTVMTLAHHYRTMPTEPLVQQVLLMVEILGLIAVMTLPILRDMMQTASEGTWQSAGRMVTRLIWGLTAYTVALWLIGDSGDQAYRWIIANPEEALVLTASLMIVWGILQFGASPSTAPAIAREGRAAGTMAAAFAATPTFRDNRYTAAHEAGHALVYAALGSLPADVKLAVNERPDRHGTLGFVTGIISRHQLKERTFAEWDMLVFLAGKMGEYVMFGESTLGSGNDHMRWLHVARGYLENHYRGMFYPDPQNKFEQEQNEAKLAALQAEQLAMLRALFDLNTEVFKQLVDALLERRTMGRDDLVPFLSRVRLPEGFPLPLGPFERFCADWPEAS